MEWMKTVFAAGCADDKETKAEIADVFSQFSYLLDPHTAVASKVLRDYRRRTGDETTAVIVSTASPFKFCQDGAAALQGDKAVRQLDAFACAEILSGVIGQDVPEQVKRLQILPVVQHAECENSSRAMGDAVMEALG